jgi:hypothetical protein
MVRFVRVNPRLQAAVRAHDWSVSGGRAIFDNQAAFYALVSRTDERSHQRSLQEVEERLDTMNKPLSELAARDRNVSFVSPLEAMCDKAWCSPVANGIYMYRDRGHLNGVGAEQLARSMRVPHMEPRS